MSEFIPFRHKSNGVVAYYPAHYIDHPVFGFDLEPYNPEEYEEDKVVIDGHDLPVDQRGIVIAVPLSELSKDELVAAAEKHGVDPKGTKAELTERIAESNKEES